MYFESTFFSQYMFLLSVGICKALVEITVFATQADGLQDPDQEMKAAMAEVAAKKLQVQNAQSTQATNNLYLIYIFLICETL